MYESRFIQNEKQLKDIHFQDTIHMFQDLNALFFIFRESLPPLAAAATLSALELSAQDKTIKKIRMTVTKRHKDKDKDKDKNNNGKGDRNHAKTKRMYHIKKLKDSNPYNYK